MEIQIQSPFLLFLVAISILQTQVEGSESSWFLSNRVGGSLECGGSPVRITNATLGQLSTCFKKTNTTNKSMPQEKNGTLTDDKVCHLVCVAKTLGMINSGGKVVREKVRGFVEVSVPVPSSRTIQIISEINACADKEESFFVVKENDCSSYRKFFLCTIQKVFKACGHDFSLDSAENPSEDESSE